HIETIAEFSGKHAGSTEAHLPDRVRVVKEYRHLVFEKTARPHQSERHLQANPFPLFRYTLKGYGTYHIHEIKKELTIRPHFTPLSQTEMKTGKNIAFFDERKLDFPLLIRNVEPGDRFRPINSHGTQKLKKYFIDHKIPKSIRYVTPIIECHDRIIWVVGHRIDESVKVDETTRQIVRMEVSLAFGDEND
ncbi:MAG: tRNA lysidine(34) synthetase TilS, partial [Thermodesulfobacteriota bacterium]